MQQTNPEHTLDGAVWGSDLFLARRYGVSRATIWRWAKGGVIPPPEKLGPNTTRWRIAAADQAVEGE